MTDTTQSGSTRTRTPSRFKSSRFVLPRAPGPKDAWDQIVYLLLDPQLKEDTPFVAKLVGLPHFRAGAQSLASRLQRGVDEVVAEAEVYLREMSAIHRQAVTDWWDRFGRWMLRGFEVVVDEDGLASLRALDHNHSLIFLFSHRSYLDEWILPTAVAASGLGTTSSFAGANLGFFPLGSLARRTGIMHVRRSIAGEPVYKFALRAYIGELLANRENLLWAIEGGRTRTGKLRPPRLGLLRYVVDGAHERCADAEVYAVPISMVYDQLPREEVSRMNAEARGREKTPEGRRWFVSYLHGLHHLGNRVGRIYLDVGEPLPMKAHLQQLAEQDPSGSKSVERLALEVCHRINNTTPVTPTAAVCIALLAAGRALTLDETLATIKPLSGYLGVRQWPTAGGANLTDRSTIRLALRLLEDSGVLLSHAGEQTVWDIEPGEHLTAANYRNSAIHVLVTRAIAEVCMLGVTEHDADHHNVWEDAMALRDLLKQEFFFARRTQFGEDLVKEIAIVDPEGAVGLGEIVDRETASRLIERLSPHVASLVLPPYLDAYAVVAHQLVASPAGDIDRKRFLRHCLRVAQQWAMQQRIASEESASLQLFENALALAERRGLLDSSAADLIERRIQFRDEIDRYRARLAPLSSTFATNALAGG